MSSWKHPYRRIISGIIGIGVAAWLTACSGPSAESSTQIAAEDPLQVAITPSAKPTDLPTQIPTPEPPMPTFEAISPTVEPADVETPVPPKVGSFDVYLTAPDDRGEQFVRWMDWETGEVSTEVAIRAGDRQAVRAGQYIYYYAETRRTPMRINTGGAFEAVTFAAPPDGTSEYDFLLSATGKSIAWASVQADGTYTISRATVDGTDLRDIATGTLAEGERLRLIRVTNDGRQVFYDVRRNTAIRETFFRGRFELYLIDIPSSRVVLLPGEPACGEISVCDAHVSPDGAFLIRTLPPTRYRQPIIVTNLVTSVVLRQFAAPQNTLGFAVDLGFPFFTPGGEMVYQEAYGPINQPSYRLIWANIVTGEQRVIVELGTDRHRPLGWAADGQSLLTTREPNAYDTWQINIVTGEIRHIAGMLFLGHIEEPAIAR